MSFTVLNVINETQYTSGIAIKCCTSARDKTTLKPIPSMSNADCGLHLLGNKLKRKKNDSCESTTLIYDQVVSLIYTWKLIVSDSTVPYQQIDSIRRPSHAP